VPVPAAAAAGATAAAAVVTTPLVAVLAGIGAGLAGRAWMRRRDDVSDEQRLTGLVAGLAALAADLRTGRSLDEATGAAAAACGDPSTGHDLVRAVRVPDRPVAEGRLREPLARLSGAVRLSGRTGCSLADVVSSVEDDLRARHRLDLELRSATAAPRAGALLLAGLPVLGLVMGSGVGADPWTVLTTTGTGQVLLVAGVGLELAGVAWSSRLVRQAVR
jgi:tight adherence protein B